MGASSPAVRHPEGFRAGISLKNPRALQLAAGDNPVGWVPDYLVEEVHGYMRSGRSLSFSVARANGPDVPWHLRLLCQLTVEPFQGSDSTS